MNQKHESQGEPHYYSQRLKKKLDSLQVVSAAIVEAPPGYGKTTAVRDYLETSVPKNTPVYWFTAVDEAPGAAFRRLCRKIDQIDSRAGQRLLHIELPNAATVGEAADALRSIDCGHEAYLVIDNFHFLQEALLPDFFAALVEHGGRRLHIIIITQVLRRDLLARVAGHRVLHITFADLRLDAEDIRRYYSLAGISITPKIAESIKMYTEGWMIAVYLQLCAFRETGTFSDRPGILALMEFLIWDPLTEEQQTFLLRLSPFEVVTAEQACFLTGCETLPQYAKNALECQFIRYEPTASCLNC